MQGLLSPASNVTSSRFIAYLRLPAAMLSLPEPHHDTAR
jgi:hypothetical protein